MSQASDARIYQELAWQARFVLPKGRSRRAPGVVPYKEFGGLYPDGVYQTMLKTDKGSGLWNGGLSLGKAEWDWMVRKDASALHVVNSLFWVTHMVDLTVPDLDRWEERTARGDRVLVLERPWRVLRVDRVVSKGVAS